MLKMRFSYNEPTGSEIKKAKAIAVGGKRPRCQKGKACSAACIDPNEFCLVEFPSPIANGLTKVKSKIEQLSLFDTSRYYSKEYLRGVEAERNSSKSRIAATVVQALRSDYQGSYDRAREEAIEFNKSLRERGISDRVKPLAIPVKWEVAKGISSRYDKTEAKLIAKLKKASKDQNRQEYDRQEKRLKELHEKLGAKLGKNNPVIVPGFFWKEKEVKPELSKLTDSGHFDSLVKKTGKLSGKLEYESDEVAKLFGFSNRQSDSDELYGNSREESSEYERIQARKGGSPLSDGLHALYKYTGDSKDAWEIRDAQRKGIDATAAGRWAKDLQSLLTWDELPRPLVEKYRGFRASPETVATMAESAKLREKFKHDTIYSWTSSLQIGKDFADAPSKVPDRTESVIFRAINTRGVPIEFVSEVTEEYEMLTPGKVKYQYLDYNIIQKNGITYHVFDVEEF